MIPSRTLFLLGPFLLGTNSCEKVRSIVSEARHTLESKTREAIEAVEEGESVETQKIDPELEALIDRNEEGILFRRDLPFPKNLKVSVSRSEPLEVRVILSSQLGKEVKQSAAIRERSFNLSKQPNSIRFSGYKEIFREKIAKSDQEGPLHITDHPLLPPKIPKDHTMKLQAGKWVAVQNRGFAEMALAQQLGPHVPTIMEEYALTPRKMWFGKRRIKTRQSISVSGELLPMLIAGKATGSLKLTLDDVHSVKGHPCGKFAIKGSYKRKSFPSLDGRVFDEEITIQSGHVWLSVIHPLILKSELNLISRRTVAEGSGPSLVIQGNSEPVTVINWQESSR